MSEGEQRDEPVGTVAEEAARLVASLSGWSGAHRTAPVDGDGSGDATAATDGSGDGEQGGGGEQQGGQPGAAGCDCACHRAGEASACRLCPICQGIALLRAVHPETLDRVADFVAMAATALHDLAEQRRTAPEATEEDGT